ncbi:MAG TPA: protein-L-isoaspartate O-methyltransferase [Rhizomicrobium sp.]|nr:protein-L-isoaspartate O-methyltransferase [Rhizomicrobium sp.]
MADPMPDFASQRANMVETQVRPNDVTDPRIHAALRDVPRERFVPGVRQALAYTEGPVEVAPQRYLMDARSFAKLLQLADIQPTDRILDVAAATGYSSAVLGQMGASVIALEQDADLVRIASDTLRATGASNVTVAQGALTEGAKSSGPYDVIFINGGVERVPESLLAQLKEGGRLVAILQSGPQGRAHIFVRQDGVVGSRGDFDTVVPVLVGFKKPVGFVF